MECNPETQEREIETGEVREPTPHFLMKNKIGAGWKANPCTPKVLDDDEEVTQERYNREKAQGKERERTADEKPS